MNAPPELHPIQLEKISVKRLSIQVWDSGRAEEFEGDIKLLLENGRGDLDKEDSTIPVGVRASIGSTEDEYEADPSLPPFSIEIEIFGVFSVDLSKFKEQSLPNWARINAPFLLLPYLREQIYGIALRAGVKGLVVPLFVQPQFPPQSKD